MAIECFGNCVNCEHLADERVDAVVCPIRVTMAMVKGLSLKLNEVIVEIAKINTKNKSKKATIEEVVEFQITEKID